MKRFFVRSVISNWAGSLINIVIRFFLTPFIVHSLGNERYGIWALLMSLVGYYGILNLGLRSATTKYVAEYAAKDDSFSLNRIVNTSLASYVILGIICFVITCVISIFFFDIFNVSLEESASIRLVVIITGFNAAISLSFNVFGAVVVAYKRFDILNSILIVMGIIRSTLIAIFLFLGYKLLTMAIIYFLTHIFENIFIAFVSFRVCEPLKISRKYVKSTTFRKIFGFSSYTFLSNVSDRILRYADTFLIGFFLNTGLITYYAIAESLIEYSLVMSKGIRRSIVPFVSESDALEEKKELQNIAIYVTRFSLLINLYIATLFFLIGKSFITLWMGKGYNLTYILLCVLMIPRLILASQNILKVTLIGMAKVRFVGLLGISEAVLNIILSILLVKYYGIIGIALGTLITLALTRIALPVYTCKQINIPLKHYLAKTVLPPFYVVVPCFILIALLVTKYEPNTYPKLIIEITISAILMVGLSFYLCCNAQMRHQIIKICRGVFSKKEKLT